jgi:DNA-binding winged helix-turn-helix (wHTH) protein/tetratricopeptide (TPR) repeat protein
MDPERQVLFCDNRPVAVTPKAFETLLVLVRRNRELVTKEELIHAVWPDSFVEEANLSQHIFMLRKALGDTDDRRFIVTLPGRGYRFAEPVRTVKYQGEALVAQTVSRTQIVVEEDEQKTDSAIAKLPSRTLPRRFCAFLPLAVILLALLVIGTSRFLHRRQAAALGDRDLLLIADFSNSTGDAVFDDTLRQGLEVQLEQSPSLKLASRDRIQQALASMGQPPEARITGEIARELCERIGSVAVMEGSIKTLGTAYVIDLLSTNCRSKEPIDHQQAQAARKEDVLAVLGKMASTFRNRVGESPESLQKYDVPITEATTGSLEALKAFSLGWKVFGSKGEEAAIPFFKHATELDPKFAMAYAALALMYGATGSSDLAAENVTRAYELRNRASNRERFFITAYYFGRAIGNQEKARQTCEEWAQTYPGEIGPHSFLSGFIYPVLADHERSVEEARKAIELEPDMGVGYYNLSYGLFNLGRIEDVANVIREAAGHKIQSPLMSLTRYDFAFFKGDEAGMQQEVAKAKSESDGGDWIIDREAFNLAYTGQLQRSKDRSRLAVKLAQQAGDRERAALYTTRAALWQAFFGNVSEARQWANEALRQSTGREVKYGAAVALAISGDATQAQLLANDLAERFPEDTSATFNYLPVIRALLALNHHNPSQAIETLQLATPYELGTPRSSLQGFFGALYPVWVRGQAYLAAQDGASAEKEFQKILDHRGIMAGDPLFALAHLGLGRAYVLSGNPPKAQASYQNFLGIWKNADANVPILIKARTELARLDRAQFPKGRPIPVNGQSTPQN